MQTTVDSQPENVSSSGTEERYVLRSRRDVLPVFSALAKWPIPISTHIAQLGVHFNSRLIAVNPAFEELVFDATGLAGLERLDGSEALVAKAQMDAVWFRFEAEHVEAARGYMQPAFRARLPKTLARMQRRDSIRYPVPAANAPVCDLVIGGEAASLRAIDISLSGIALRVDNMRVKIEMGSTFEDTLLHLPNIGAIQTGLAVAYLSPVGDGDSRRLGCRFSNIRPTALSHLQRYISRLERARLEAHETQ